MKYIFIIVSSLTIFVNSIFSQEVVSASGSYFENTNGSLSWTIGEIMIETYSESSNIITQGFQQSRLTITSVFKLPFSNIEISIAPNPTTNFVKIKISDTENMCFQLFDYNGKLIKQENFITEETKISFSSFAYAAYFLKIIKNNTIIRTFQIIKQ